MGRQWRSSANGVGPGVAVMPAGNMADESNDRLRARISQLEGVLAALPECFVVVDRTGRYTYVSPSFEKLLARFGPVQGHTWQELGLPESLMRDIEKQRAQVFEDGLARCGVGTVTLDGELRSFEYSHSPIRGAAGPIEALVVTIRDATLRVSAQVDRDLQASRLQSIVDHAPISVFACDAAGMITTVEGALNWSHAAPDRPMPGRSVFDVFQDSPGMLSKLRRALAGLTQQGDFELEQRRIDLWCAPIRGADQAVTGVFAVATDITERSRAEEALRESEARYRYLFESTSDLVQAVRPDGSFAFVNPAWRRALGYGEAELALLNYSEVIHPDDRAACEALRRRALRGESVRGVEIRFLTKDGRSLYVEGDVSGRQEKSLTLHTMGVFRDVTARKRKEEALRRSRDDLELRVQERTAELLKIQELDELKTNFVNAVSHELRTPLTAILGYGEFLEEGLGGVLTPFQRDYVGQMLEGARRLSNLVDDLLDYAKMEGGTFVLRLEDANLCETIRGVADAFRLQLAEAHLRLDLDLRDCPLTLRLDPKRMTQVLANLVSNAIKFTPAEGTITLRAFRSGSRICCQVTDTGIGIPDEDLPKLFKRFSQISQGVRKGGTGLGLSISKSLVEAHGGQIGVRSTVGMGSTFWFELPLGLSELPPAEPLATSSGVRSSPTG